MKTITKTLALLLAVTMTAQAGLISRTYSYTDGNTISANENNTNETTLYNEINGNLDGANVEDGGLGTNDFADSSITTGKIADSNITMPKLASVIQSTITYVNTLGTYRRPTIIYVSATTIEVEENTGTDNETCVHFPDERRCVTEDTSSTSVNRRFIITETASFTGTKNSGMAPGETEANDTWYAIYAVKVQDNSTDFVIVGSTNTPIQSRYATLNTLYGENDWVYLGMIRNGDSSAAASSILQFKQSADMFIMVNAVTSSQSGGPGVLLANSASTTSLVYSYTTGTSGAVIPAHFSLIYVYGGGAILNRVTTTGGNVRWLHETNASSGGLFWMYAGADITITNNSAGQASLMLSGWSDKLLGAGYNAQL